MKRTVFIAGCAIAFSGMAGAMEQAPTEPNVMSFAEFEEVGMLAGWTLPTLRSLTSELALGTDLAPMVVADSGSDNDDKGGDDDRGDNSGHGSDHDDDDDDNDDSNDDDSDDDDDDDDDSNSGRDKPRIPGGSGCDDPGDVAEHAECRG